MASLAENQVQTIISNSTKAIELECRFGKQFDLSVRKASIQIQFTN